MGTVRYTVIDGEVVSELRGGVKRDYVPDPLGSTVALLDNTQTITDTFQYWPYGESAARTGTTATPFQYVGSLGYYNDGNSKYYVRARFLDSSLGVWTTEDPIGINIGDINIYKYCSDSPITSVDPLGLTDKYLIAPGIIKNCSNKCIIVCSDVEGVGVIRICLPPGWETIGIDADWFYCNGKWWHSKPAYYLIPGAGPGPICIVDDKTKPGCVKIGDGAGVQPGPSIDDPKFSGFPKNMGINPRDNRPAVPLSWRDSRSRKYMQPHDPRAPFRDYINYPGLPWLF